MNRIKCVSLERVKQNTIPPGGPETHAEAYDVQAAGCIKKVNYRTLYSTRHSHAGITSLTSAQSIKNADACWMACSPYALLRSRGGLSVLLIVSHDW